MLHCSAGRKVRVNDIRRWPLPSEKGRAPPLIHQPWYVKPPCDSSIPPTTNTTSPSVHAWMVAVSAKWQPGSLWSATIRELTCRHSTAPANPELLRIVAAPYYHHVYQHANPLLSFQADTVNNMFFKP